MLLHLYRMAATLDYPQSFAAVLTSRPYRKADCSEDFAGNLHFDFTTPVSPYNYYIDYSLQSSSPLRTLR